MPLLVFYDTYRELHQLLFNSNVRRRDCVVLADQDEQCDCLMRRVGLTQTYAMVLSGERNILLALHTFDPQRRPR